MTLTPQEQYMLELINRARLNPDAEAARLGIGLNEGVTGGTITSAAKQVLAPNAALEAAARGHSQWMMANDTFSHDGAGGSKPDDRIKAAGYAPGAFWWGENLGQYLTTGTIDLDQVSADLYDGLFLSAQHRENLLRDVFREIGIGIETGTFTTTQPYNAALVTQNFGQVGSAVFLTGVAYSDRDDDNFYSIGEGVANVGFQIGGTTVRTVAAGGYGLSTGAGSAVSVTVTQGASSSVVTVDLSAGNVKLDLVDGSMFRTSGNLTLVSGVADAELLGVGNLTLRGNAAGNYLAGNNGSNFLFGNAGADTLSGGDGTDYLIGGAGADRLNGGAGTDRAQYHQSATGLRVDLQFVSTNSGEAAGDTFTSIEDIFGSFYDDLLFGDGNANALIGATGDDQLYGRGGNDRLAGGDGDDRLIGGPGADQMDGGAGTDWAQYHQAAAGLRADLVYRSTNTGEAAGDSYFRVENLFGSRYADFLFGDNAANTVAGHLGDDQLYGRGGNDRLVGADGNDRLIGGEGADQLDGGAGSDWAQYHQASSGVRADLLSPSGNNGEATGDTFVSVENLFGSRYNDVLLGTHGANTISGQMGSDALLGRGGNDRLAGGDGNDTLDGGSGRDTMVGGNGSDTFVFRFGSRADEVSDFSIAGGDRLALDDAFWPGTLTAASVVSAYASVSGGDVVFDFGGGNVLTLEGLGSTVGLDAQIDFV